MASSFTSPTKKRKIELQVEVLPPSQPQSVIASFIPKIATKTPSAPPSTSSATINKDEKGPEDKSELRLPSEKELGMTSFLDKDRPGFVAIFKQRYGDFIVREVDQEGNVVRLTDVTNLPRYDIEADEKSNRIIDEAETTAVFNDLLGEQAAVLLEYARLPEADKRRTEKITLRGEFASNKEMRTKVHLAIKEHYKLLFAETKKDEATGEAILVVSYALKRHRAHFSDWPRDKPDYVRFTLFKENKDTNNVIDLLCKLLRVTPKLFGTAGIKDKRAVTTQHVTGYRIPAERLLNLNPKLYGVKLGNFEYVKEPLKLGSLQGNHFTITLRNIVAPMDVLQRAAEKVKTHGFINYFGTQRFGTGTIGTHEVGRLLLQEKWSEAIDFLLKPRPFEEAGSTEARKYFAATKDVNGTIAKMPRKHVIERNLLYAMKQHGNNHLNAFSELPYNVRLLYVHAYQSYIFNSAASHRIESVGHLNPIFGDLVLNSTSGEYEYITEENISKYTLDDIYLPLPGWDNKYPNNETGAWMKNFMKKDGVDPDNMRRGQKVFSLPGGYRKLIARPKSFDYRILRYSDYTVPLAKTDLDLLSGKDLAAEDPNGNLLGMVIEMILDSSTYATMLLRELTKNETGALYQRHIQATVVDKSDKGEEGVPDDGDDDEEAFALESGGYEAEVNEVAAADL